MANNITMQPDDFRKLLMGESVCVEDVDIDSIRLTHANSYTMLGIVIEALASNNSGISNRDLALYLISTATELKDRDGEGIIGHGP